MEWKDEEHVLYSEFVHPSSASALAGNLVITTATTYLPDETLHLMSFSQSHWAWERGLPPYIKMPTNVNIDMKENVQTNPCQQGNVKTRCNVFS